MTDMPRLSRDARTVRRMADINGLDLAQATRKGRVTVDQVSDMVASCGACAAKAACRGWLARHHTPVDRAPGFCRNTPFLDALRAG